jgi:hypothetical protein
MTFHELKTWPEPFRAIALGRKHHEVRRADRDFQVGDALLLKEYDPTLESFTGAERIVEVTYISRGGTFGLPENLCVMSIRKVSQ